MSEAAERHPSRTPHTPHELRAVAVRAGVDPRTVVARLAGRPQHSTVVARVDNALRELGFAAGPSQDATSGAA